MDNKYIKILFITYTLSNGGGAEKILATLVNNLDKKKYKIVIQEITNFDKKKEGIEPNIVLKKYPVIYNKKIFKWLSDANYYFLYNFPEVLKSIFRWEGFDVIISWNYQLPSFALLGFENEFKISHFHGAVDDLNIENYPLKTKQFIKQKKVWEKVDLITTISNYSKESAIKIFPEIKNKIKIIYNGTDTDEIIRKSNEYNPDIPRNGSVNLISVARLDENKNISLVLKALKILKSNKINFKYYIIGDGEYKNKLERETKEYSIEDSVIFLGYVTNPLPIIKKCDVLCLSSLSEGWPTVITEAMALKKPFITTPVAGAKDELSDNNCGLVSDFSYQCYAQQLIKLINDSKLRITMGENGFNNIKNYSVERMVNEFESVIDYNCKKINSNITRLDQTIFNYIKYILFICVGIPYVYKNISYICEHKNRYNLIKKRKEIFAIIYRCFLILLDIILLPIIILPRALCAIVFCFIIGKDK